MCVIVPIQVKRTENEFKVKEEEEDENEITAFCAIYN